MTNWNLEENVTSLEDSKLLKEHGIMEGIEPDGYWVNIRNEWKFWSMKAMIEWLSFKENTFADIYYYHAYRLDKLLAKLPEWWHKFKLVGVEFYAHTQDYLEAWVEKKAYSEDFLKSLYGSICYKGQAQIKACVQLLVLLKKEGVE